MIRAHAVCDYEPCGAVLFTEEDGASVDESFLLETGWVLVKWASEDEEEVDLGRDFCSFLCASRWCASVVDTEAVVSEQQMPRLDDDE